MSNEPMKTPGAESTELLAALTALRNGDFSVRLSPDGAAGTDQAEVARVFNELTEMLSVYASEVRRVSWETGTNGRFGAQAEVDGVRGDWQTTLTEFNGMVGNLTNQVRNFAQVTTAIATGDLSHKVTVGTDGEMQEWKDTVNIMVDQLNAFAGELIRVSREVVGEGRTGSQMQVRGASGAWQKQIESVNALAAKGETAASSPPPPPSSE
ncbi:MAG: HAMP domain-containing protein [Fibrella sp.]|nr:HAMP domain-containing protein [Armatimonadota bacterium]